MKHKILSIYSWFIRTTLFFLPDIPLFMKIRGRFYSFGMKSCGKNFQITHNVILNTLENLSVGKNVYIAYNCVLLVGGEIVIEDEVMLGPNVVIASRNHTKVDGSFRFGIPRRGNVFIGSGSWIAANCTLVPGAYLPRGSILGANSLLNKKFTVNDSLYVGIPAKLLKIKI